MYNIPCMLENAIIHASGAYYHRHSSGMDYNKNKIAGEFNWGRRIPICKADNILFRTLNKPHVVRKTTHSLLRDSVSGVTTDLLYYQCVPFTIILLVVFAPCNRQEFI